ncbi:MAG: ParA family protein [Candidatus Anammoxibacter sp.]
METRTIAITNQKGGVAKTTTAVNLGACLAKLERKVLLLDLDPQGNLSSWFGININQLDKSLYDVFLEKAEISSIIKNSCVNNLDIAPSNVSLANVERIFANHDGREKILQKRLSTIINQYDYVLFDCPPSLGLLTINVLTTVREIIIPLETKVLSLNGLVTLLNTAQLIKKSLNHNLNITGILACKYDQRTNLSRMVVDKIKTGFNNKVFKTIIRESTKLAECPISNLPITQYAPHSHGAYDYLDLAKEVIEGESKFN